MKSDGFNLLPETFFGYSWNKKPYIDLIGSMPQRKLSSMTGISIEDIPLSDEKVVETLGQMVSEDEKAGLGYAEIFMDNANGRLDVFLDILNRYGVKNLEELVYVVCLSCGLDLWNKENEKLLKEGYRFYELVSNRDDVAFYLMSRGIKKERACQIMESVRKGCGLTIEMERVMKEAGVPDWYVSSCKNAK